MKEGYELIYDKIAQSAVVLQCRGRFQDLADLQEQRSKSLYDWLRFLCDDLELAWKRTYEHENANIPNGKLNNELMMLYQWFHDEFSKAEDSPILGKCFFQLFEDIAQEHPQKTAATYRKNELNYANLNERANILAHKLIALKKQNHWSDGAAIAICFDNSPQALITLLAIMKAGLAYVPITVNADLKRERLLAIINAVKPERLIVDNTLQNHEVIQYLAQSYQKGHDWILAYDDHATANSIERNNPINISVKLTQRAAIFFSSGSTGIAKGIEVSHRGLVAPAKAIGEKFGFVEGDRLTWYSSLNFDASLLDIMTAIVNKITLVIIPHEIRTDSKLLQEHPLESNVTHIIVTPTVLSLLDPAALTNLKGYITMGEKGHESLFIKYHIKNKWHNYIKGINGYGPTEVSICTSLSEIIIQQIDSQLKVVNLNIGDAPIPGLSWFVMKVDATEQFPAKPQLAIDGEEGELYIAGEGLALGYLVTEDLDSSKLKRFRTIIDPRDTGKMIEVYQSGDMVVKQNDHIVFQRRIDDEVKINGALFNPHALENAICQYISPASHAYIIKRAKVVVRGSELKIKHLKAIVEMTDELKAGANQQMISREIRQLMAYLRRHPACTILPSRLFIVNEWKVNANAKADIKLIEEPKNGQMVYCSSPFRLQPSPSPLSPDKRIMDVVVKLWHDVLDIPEDFILALDDNFKDLGGDSVRFSLLASALREKYGYHLPMSDYNNNFTLRVLVQRIKGYRQNTALDSNKLIIKLSKDRPHTHCPIILINSVSGNAREDFKHLISDLEKSHHPLYCTNLTDNPGYMVNSLEELAQDYTECILSNTALKVKMLILIGYSAGGSLAQAISRQLEKQEILSAVCCIDTLAPMYYQNLSGKAYAHEIKRLLNHVISKKLGLNSANLAHYNRVSGELDRYQKDRQLSCMLQALMEDCHAMSESDLTRIIDSHAMLHNLVQLQLSYNDDLDNIFLISFNETIAKCYNDPKLAWKIPSSQLRQLTGKHLDVVDDAAWVKKELLPRIKSFCDSATARPYLQQMIDRAKACQYKKALFIDDLTVLCSASKRPNKISIVELLANLSRRELKHYSITSDMGMGKSITADFLVYQWLRQKSLIEFDLVLKFDMLELISAGFVKELEDIKAYAGNSDFSILLVLDNFDHANKYLLSIVKVLEKYKCISIIRFSRPTEGFRLDKFIKLPGNIYQEYLLKSNLTQENINKYIVSYFKEKDIENEGSHLIDEAANNKTILKLLETPWQLKLLCKYWLIKPKSEKSIVTKLFQEFIVIKMWTKFSKRYVAKYRHVSENIEKEVKSKQKKFEGIIIALAKTYQITGNLKKDDIKSAIKFWHSSNNTGEKLGLLQLNEIEETVKDTAFLTVGCDESEEGSISDSILPALTSSDEDIGVIKRSDSLPSLQHHSFENKREILADGYSLIYKHDSFVLVNEKKGIHIALTLRSNNGRSMYDYGTNLSKNNFKNAVLPIKEISFSDSDMKVFEQYLMQHRDNLDGLLNFVARRGYIEMCHALIVLGVDINSQAPVIALEDNSDGLNAFIDDGRTPLIWAISGKNNPALVGLLLSLGANISLVTKTQKWAALHFALAAFDRDNQGEMALEVLEILSCYQPRMRLVGEPAPEKSVLFHTAKMPMRLALSANAIPGVNYDICFSVPIKFYQKQLKAGLVEEDLECVEPKWFQKLIYMLEENKVSASMLTKQVGGCLIYFRTDYPEKFADYWGHYIVNTATQEICFITDKKDILAVNFEETLDKFKFYQVEGYTQFLPLSFEQQAKVFPSHKRDESIINLPLLFHYYKMMYYKLIGRKNSMAKQSLFSDDERIMFLEDIRTGVKACSKGWQEWLPYSIQKAIKLEASDFSEFLYLFKQYLINLQYDDALAAKRVSGYHDDGAHIHEKAWNSCVASLGFGVPGILAADQWTGEFFKNTTTIIAIMNKFVATFKPYSLAKAFEQFLQSYLSEEGYVGYKGIAKAVEDRYPVYWLCLNEEVTLVGKKPGIYLFMKNNEEAFGATSKLNLYALIVYIGQGAELLNLDSIAAKHVNKLDKKFQTLLSDLKQAHQNAMPAIKANKGFIRIKIGKNADSGFDALDTTRQAAFELLFQHKHEESIQTILKTVVKEELMVNDKFCAYVRAQHEELNNDSAEALVASLEIKDRYNLILNDYLEFDIKNSRQGVHISVLIAIMKIRGEQARIWVLHKGMLRRHVDYYNEFDSFIVKDSKTVRDILFGEQFDLLRLAGIDGNNLDNEIPPYIDYIIANIDTRLKSFIIDNAEPYVDGYYNKFANRLKLIGLFKKTIDLNNLFIRDESDNCRDINWQYLREYIFDFVLSSGCFVSESPNPWLDFCGKKVFVRDYHDAINYYSSNHVEEDHLDAYLQLCIQTFAKDKLVMLGHMLSAAVVKRDIKFIRLLKTHGVDLDYLCHFDKASLESIEYYNKFLGNIKFKEEVANLTGAPQRQRQVWDAKPKVKEESVPEMFKQALFNPYWFHLETALMLAIRHDWLEGVELLLELGAGVNCTNDVNWTALHAAGFLSRQKTNNAEAILKLLFSLKANPTIKTKDEKIALQMTWYESAYHKMLREYTFPAYTPGALLTDNFQNTIWARKENDSNEMDIRNTPDVLTL